MMVSYLSNTYDKKYNYKVILETQEKFMLDISKKYHLGYSLCNFVSARNKVHPNYEKFFKSEIKDIDINVLNSLTNAIPYDKKSEFNVICASKVVEGYNNSLSDVESYKKLKLIIANKKIIIDNFSNSSNLNFGKYNRDIFLISINTISNNMVDALFIDSLEKYNYVKNKIRPNTIIITPLAIDDEKLNILQFNYFKLLTNQLLFKTDLSIVILLQILTYCDAKEIFIGNYEITNNTFLKYKISKFFEKNRKEKSGEIANRYVRHFNENYNLNIKRLGDA